MRQLSIGEAHQQLYAIIESGETVMIERDGAPIVQFAPVPMTPDFRKEVLKELAESIAECQAEDAGALGSRS